MGQVRWTESAFDDLRDIAEYVSRNSPLAAEKLVARILDAPRRLAVMPRSGAIIPEFRRDTIREVVVRPYRIIYCIRDDDCIVVAIVHGQRDLAHLIDRDNRSEEEDSAEAE